MTSLPLMRQHVVNVINFQDSAFCLSLHALNFGRRKGSVSTHSGWWFADHGPHQRGLAVTGQRARTMTKACRSFCLSLSSGRKQRNGGRARRFFKWHPPASSIFTCRCCAVLAVLPKCVRNYMELSCYHCLCVPELGKRVCMGRWLNTATQLAIQCHKAFQACLALQTWVLSPSLHNKNNKTKKQDWCNECLNYYKVC